MPRRGQVAQRGRAERGRAVARQPGRRGRPPGRAPAPVRAAAPPRARSRSPPRLQRPGRLLASDSESESGGEGNGEYHRMQARNEAQDARIGEHIRECLQAEHQAAQPAPAEQIPVPPADPQVPSHAPQPIPRTAQPIQQPGLALPYPWFPPADNLYALPPHHDLFSLTI